MLQWAWPFLLTGEVGFCLCCSRWRFRLVFLIYGYPAWKLLPKPTCRRTTRTNITINFGFLNLQCYFGEAVCTGLFRTDFLHGFSARIFCTDFLHGFLHGFSARIFCTDFLRGFSAQIFIVCAGVARIFARIFWGVPKHLLGSAKISPRKSPEKFTMLWGPSGRGSGGRRVR